MSSGVLLLIHPITAAIGESDVLEALPPSLRAAPRRVVTLAPIRIEPNEAVDWQDARKRQERAFREQLKPVIDSHPDFRLHYFGMAPIPLAMHLGYLVGDFSRTEIHQLSHAPRREWRWASDDTPAPALLPVKPLPETLVEGDVIIRVSVSHRVGPMDTRTVVPRPLCEIDLGLESPDEDALQAPAHLDAVARQFDRALDAIARALPNAERIHVFASVPVGLAFRLGGRPNSTIHAPVVTYQYDAGRAPRHEKAIVLQRKTDLAIALTDGDRDDARALRDRAARELELIHRFGSAPRERGNWWEEALPVRVDSAPFTGRWRTLAPLRATCLMNTRIDESANDVDDSFELRDDRWRFDDALLAAICRRLRDPIAQDRAMRMFLFHEGIHQTSHRLTRATSHGMRPLPRILEELDYQGDVWAMVHEYGFNHWDSRRPAPSDARTAFGAMIDTAIETCWAFDDDGIPCDRFEIRRLNRYLIWYWQALRVSHAGSLAEVLRILAERPLVEIAGPRTHLDDERVVYCLEPQDLDEPELAVLGDDDRIHRFGHSAGSRVREVLEGFRARRSEQIAGALRSIFDQIRE